MNRKQLLILVVFVAVLGAVGLMLYQRNQSSWQGGGRQGTASKLLGDLPVNDVAAIVIKGGTDELDLVRKDNLWRVAQRNDYPANFGDISGFLLKAADLKAAQVEEVGRNMHRPPPLCTDARQYLILDGLHGPRSRARANGCQKLY